MNAAATAGSPPQARAWNGSCPGTPAPKTSSPGHSHHSSPTEPHDHAPQRRGPRRSPRRLLACPLTGLPNTYTFRACVLTTQNTAEDAQLTGSFWLPTPRAAVIAILVSPSAPLPRVNILGASTTSLLVL